MVRTYLVLAGLLICWLVIAQGMSSHGSDDQVTSANLPSDRWTDLKFSHKLHTVDLGLQCVDCHSTAATSTMSKDVLSTDHEKCNSCHEEQINNDCKYCHKNPDQIVAPTPVEPELKFSHAQHLGMDSVSCATCHSGIETSEDLADVHLPSMKTCSSCHNDQLATTMCETCHTDFVSLLPVDHYRSDFLRNHREISRVGNFEAKCQTCHAESFCQQCHQGAVLKSFGVGDAITDPDPKHSPGDNAEQQRLTFVHELNYRFTHAIDARAIDAECSSCHETETFCVDCHRQGGILAKPAFKPASHSVPGFVTIGRGSGGGFHAEDARRNMESCISCHDVEGQDPVCLTCHAEGGGVR